MLSPARDDDDDDSHLCIKCNATIIGLDNYVKHRKERCGKKYEAIKAIKEIPSLDTLEPSYSLGADVFFQSLELQSSVKKTTLARLTPPIATASKTAQSLDKKTLSIASSSRDIARMSPIETSLRGEDWIGGHSLRIGTSEDNQTKLINAVASISGVVKKDITNSSYNIGTYNDYKGDDESDVPSEDSEDDDEDEPSVSGGKWKPPPNYTGGKWRPASPEHEDWDIRDEQEHTGGKWKPLLLTEGERDDDYDAPPPGHTKGKWVPGAQESKTQIMQTTLQNKGSVQYWCGPCNRRLGSRTIYEKHLMSSLHMRKVLPENDLEFSGHIEPTAAKATTLEKRIIRPSQYMNDSIYSVHNKTQKPSEVEINKTKKKRNRKLMYTQCSGCKSRVRKHLMGKHLISHYHFRKAADVQTTGNQDLILDNIHAIVRQSPFQCSPCKFYTNWLSNFMQHWFSEEHEQKMASIEGRYWCSFCKFECQSSQDMLAHMASTDHGEVVAVINRSMPIIIRKKSIFKCKTCLRDFRYNIEVKRHCRSTGHELAHTATDQYQELHNCQHCGVKFRSSLSLVAHLKTKHKENVFFCFVCSKKFATALEAKQHRATSEHRVTRKEKLNDLGLASHDLKRKCPYCVAKVYLKNVLKLKEHIRNEHPDLLKKCPKCGMAFTLSQEVTHHIKSNACQFQPTQLKSPIIWQCSQCLFTTDSQAECLFHEVLHNTPNTDTSENKKQIRYSCPICFKLFRKVSLRLHMRQHTLERPFSCDICGANFTRQTTLANHRKNEHRATKNDDTTQFETNRSSFPAEPANTNKQTADTDDASGRSSQELACPHEACDFVTGSMKQLISHRKSHGEILKQHVCSICPFKTDQTSHLRRHMRCHEGVKPYSCPHCSFTCGSLENLRKHVLRSGRHPGAALYACRECRQFSTNLATELRAHLVEDHPHKYSRVSAVQAVKRYLMADGSGGSFSLDNNM